MIRVLYGHRGTGKSSLLVRLQEYFGSTQECYDLDTEIEKREGRSIFDIFRDSGEEYFRELEVQTLLQIAANCAADTFIVVGAGFRLAFLPQNVQRWWIRRETDLDGRVFTDRPRLDGHKQPLEEYLQRAEAREEIFLKNFDRVYTLPEGVNIDNAIFCAAEKALFFQNWELLQKTITLLPDFTEEQLRDWLRAGMQIELRDDLLTDEKILEVLSQNSPGRFLFSFRRVRDFQSFWLSNTLSQIKTSVEFVDWAWELGSPEGFISNTREMKTILSLHQSNNEDLLKYEDRVDYLKWSPEIHSWEALASADNWQKQKKSSRIFLPRSEDGRWKWYRLYQMYFQSLNFVREGAGSAFDQPTLLDALMLPAEMNFFAAVLGDPVRHSHSPLEHGADFYFRKAPFWAITLGQEDFVSAFQVLKKMGLRAAAVTSPLKEKATQVVTATACELKALNTLWISSDSVEGISTDGLGFTELIADLDQASEQKDIVIWGGGGTLEDLKKSLPRSQYYSSTRGEAREGSVSVDKPRVLVWAAPRTALTKFPPSDWNPERIYDLNYKEDSMGREYAQRVGGTYISGLKMFKAQAQAQRSYWKMQAAKENL